MINKVTPSTTPSPQNQQPTTAANDMNWEQYAKAIYDAKATPMKKYAITIPMFSLGKMGFPAWQIPDFVKAGFDPYSLPPSLPRRIIVAEDLLAVLQQEVPGYLLDIVEVDPLTEQPLQTAKSAGNLSPSLGQTPTSAALLPSHIAAAAKNEAPPEPARSQTATGSHSTSSTSSKVGQPSKQKARSVLPEAQPFDFTRLTPELEQTTIRLAEQLLTAALHQLSGTDQFSDLSSFLDRTA